MRTALALAVVLACPFSLGADTLHVPAQYNTIRDAIIAAGTGDTVLVAPGTYAENLNFRGKAITVKSSGGASVTAIDGNKPTHPDYKSTVVFNSGEGPDSMLDGFTLRYGKGSKFEIHPNYWDVGGGGIFCEESSPTIINNVIMYNNVDHTGGGICCHRYANPVITNNIIRDNSAKVDAAGLYCGDHSSPLVTNNFIHLNDADGCGGGILCRNNSDAIILDNEIYDNNADVGGALACYASSPIIDNNLISGNNAYGFYGGGIFCQDCCPEITNNEIVYNELNGTYGSMGGGIAFEGSSGLIRNNLILGNESFDQGGGISLSEFSHPTIEENRILQNMADQGGGIDCFVDCNPLILNNTISENEVIARGGGIHCYMRCSPLIGDNKITGNLAGAGGGIYCYFDCDSEITNNIISRNKVDGAGGGICCSRGTPILTSNAIYWNEAGLLGGGIYCDSSGHPIVINSILWKNSAPDGKEAYLHTVGTPASLTISYSVVQGGVTSISVDPGSTLNWGAGMIDSDPQFAAPDQGDFHLTFNSPCKDSGSNAAPGLFVNDFEGDPRIAYGTVDMGADEFHPHLYYMGDAVPSGRIKVKCIGIPGTLVNGILFGLKIFDPPLPCDYGLWYLDDPFQIYTGLGAIPANGVSVIPGTLPATPIEPYTFYLQAAIDSWLTNLCVVHVE